GFLLAVRAANIFLATTAGFLGGATLAPPVSEAIARNPVLAPYCQAISTGLIVFGIAVTMLLFGEIIAGGIAAVRPAQFARIGSRPLRVLAVLTQPMLQFSTKATDRVFNALGLRSTLEPQVTQEQIEVLIHEGTKAGVFEAEEHELL